MKRQHSLSAPDGCSYYDLLLSLALTGYLNYMQSEHKCNAVQVNMLCELMGVNQEDEEFMLQIAHSLSPLLMCQATRTVLLENTQVSSTRFHSY